MSGRRRRRRPLLGRLGRPVPPGAAVDAAAELVESLAVLLDAGLPPPSAWSVLAESAGHPAARRIASVIGRGSPPADALLAEARQDDALAVPAAAWFVAETAGAPLARSLRGLAEALRDRAETEREVDVALSGPRATARLVGSLPLVGLAMATALGIDVIGALTGSTIGWMLLLVGVGLGVAGRQWTRSLVKGASPGSGARESAIELLMIALASGMSLAGSRQLVAQAQARAGLRVGEPAAVSQVLRLSERAGAPAGELLGAAALQQRRLVRAAGRTSATALGVRLLLPVGACVLPSFVALGVAPVLLALVSSTGIRL